MSRRVILLQGGGSEEREISLKSSSAIHEALSESGYETITLDPQDFSSYLDLGEEILSINPDIVFVGLHGGGGENGTIQAFLSLLNVPFTGSDMRSSSLCMDKEQSFALASRIGIKVPRYYVWNKANFEEREQVIRDLNFPLVIKPNSSGSSVGINIVRDIDEFNPAVCEAFRYSEKIIIQQYIAGSELTVSILGDTALPVVEIKVNDGWYDYRNKYTKGKTIYEVPAALTKGESERIQQMSLSLFRTFGCRAYARVDFRYDGKDFYFLEVNTLPGMTSLSLTPMAAKEAGISFPRLVELIIEYSLHD